MTDPITSLDDVKNLDDLLDLIMSDGFDSRSVDMAWLPTFGGKEPDDTTEVWSWDDTRLLVGGSSYDYKIVDRSEWSS